jgi:hypothetical protein
MAVINVFLKVFLLGMELAKPPCCSILENGPNLSAPVRKVHKMSYYVRIRSKVAETVWRP